jgi:hypothetical protein
MDRGPRMTGAAKPSVNRSVGAIINEAVQNKQIFIAGFDGA